MSKTSTGLAFVAGLTIGAAGAWYYLKDKYAKLAEEEIASVKAAYAKREKPTTEEKTVSLVNAAKNMDKGSITEYTQRLQEAGYKDYSRTIDEKPSGTPGEVPYVISPDEFGELEDYTKVKLGYFHRWEQWSKVVDASPLRGGHPGGQNGQVFGIVEFEDGVRRVGPSSIKFCDEENAILCEMAKHHEALRRGEANAES